MSEEQGEYLAGSKNGVCMEALVSRLEMMRREAEALIDLILESGMEDCELICSPLYNAKSAADEVVGDLMLRQLRAGRLRFVAESEVGNG